MRTHSLLRVLLAQRGVDDGLTQPQEEDEGVARVLHQSARPQVLGHLGLDAGLDGAVELALLAAEVERCVVSADDFGGVAPGVLIVFDGRTIRGLPSSVDCFVRRLRRFSVRLPPRAKPVVAKLSAQAAKSLWTDIRTA